MALLPTPAKEKSLISGYKQQSEYKIAYGILLNLLNGHIPVYIGCGHVEHWLYQQDWQINYQFSQDYRGKSSEQNT